jgi:hypothetical protein
MDCRVKPGNDENGIASSQALLAMTTHSAAELTLGGWHFARRARIDRDSRAQRPRQTLEAGFGDMVAVLAI